MDTLLLRLAAPLQSWGSSSRFSHRMTQAEPTKSGVVGLVAAALGLQRGEALDELNALVFGVRVDQPGQLLQDFHTAHIEGEKASRISYRHYIADAVFLVGLSGDRVLLSRIEDALQHPYYALCLGRRACPPTLPLSLGCRKDIGLKEALVTEKLWASEWYCKKAPKTIELDLFSDADSDGSSVKMVTDLPLSFSQKHRRYTFRPVVWQQVKVENPAGREQQKIQARPVAGTTHDALGALEVE